MKGLKNKKDLLILTSIISYFFCFSIYTLDFNFNKRWFVLFLFIFYLSLIFLIYLKSLNTFKFNLKLKKLYLLLILILLAIITRFFLLTEYPFVSVGDELRDGGLDAMTIAIGEKKNFWSYGRYNSHGLIIPTLLSFFYKIFGNSVLVYRLPAAVASILNIILFYFLLIFISKNEFSSFLGTLVLISLPLHLFYSRTEIVVILSSLFSTILLIVLYIFYIESDMINYIFLGTLIGFGFNLHASIKSMGISIFIVVVFFTLSQLVLKKIKMKEAIIKLALFVVFVLMGFGPTLINTSPDIFFHTDRLTIIKEKNFFYNLENFKKIIKLYGKSLLVWVKEPTNSWYPDKKPIFSPLIFLLMFVGIIASFFKINLFLISIFFIFLLLHLSNSALTDIINADHRLAPLYPIGVLFVGLGTNYILKIKSNLVKYILFFVLLIVLFYKTILFFYNRPADYNKDIGDYLSMNTIYFLKKNDNLNKSKNLVFLVSPSNYVKLNYLHYKEQYNFFFPKINILIEKSETLTSNYITSQKPGFSLLRQNPKPASESNWFMDNFVKDNEIYIFNMEKGLSGYRFVVNCSEKKYHCPVNYRGKIVINY